MEPESLEELARQEVVSLLPMLRRLPRHVDRIATSVERGTLRARLSLFSDASDLAAMTKFVNRGVLAFLGGIVGLLSVMLLTSTNGPRLTRRSSSSSATSACSAPRSCSSASWWELSGTGSADHADGDLATTVATWSAGRRLETGADRLPQQRGERPPWTKAPCGSGSKDSARQAKADSRVRRRAVRPSIRFSDEVRSNGHPAALSGPFWTVSFADVSP